MIYSRELFEFEEDDGVDHSFELVTVLEIPNVAVRRVVNIKIEKCKEMCILQFVIWEVLFL